MQSTVLILGARGRFGLVAARAFADARWRVQGLIRPGAQVPAEAAADRRIEWLTVDLQDTAAIARAAQGASVVVHALNPSAYTHKAWRTQALPMTEAAIDIARALNATLMLMGNVYNFGADMPAVLTEDTPQRARTIKGQIRIAMEEHIRRSGVRAIVIRAGDFFGSGKGTWFDQAIVKDIQKGKFTYPGHKDVATAWAYLPDLARTFAEVAARRDTFKTFEVFHFAGHSITGQQWLDAMEPIAQAQGWVKPHAGLRYSQLPWPIIRIGALFVPTWASLLEMRYLWDKAHALDNRKLVALLGAEPHTPLDQAAGMALHDLGLTKNTAETPATLAKTGLPT
ncbi:MAG: NAD(P)H-binding protein [Rhodoferax sp.]|nr:NAD(P)H-binding protein [Rhodoferax sp.]